MTCGGGFSALLIDGVLLLGTSNYTPFPPFIFMTLVTPLTSPEPLNVYFYQMGIVSVPGLTHSMCPRCLSLSLISALPPFCSYVLYETIDLFLLVGLLLGWHILSLVPVWDLQSSL